MPYQHPLNESPYSMARSSCSLKLKLFHNIFWLSRVFFFFLMWSTGSSLLWGHSCYGKQGLISRCGGWTSHCSGFSYAVHQLQRAGFCSCYLQVQ